MFKIILDRESLNINIKENYSTITANFYCKLSQDSFFPFKEWNDLLLSVSDMWSNSLISLITFGDATFDFMEGPYYFEAICKDKVNLDIVFYKGDKEFFSERLFLSDFVEELFNFIGITIKTIKNYEIYGNELIKSKSLKSLEINFKKLQCLKID